MKKMIALVMVIGMASLASAGLVLSGVDDVATITGVDNGTGGAAAWITMAGSTTDATATMVYTGNASLLVGNNAYIAYAASYAGVALDSMYEINFYDTTVPAEVSADGTLLTWTGKIGDTIYLHDFTTLAVVGSYTFIPEPMTLGLLGLGGLLIRRRK